MGLPTEPLEGYTLSDAANPPTGEAIAATRDGSLALIAVKSWWTVQAAYVAQPRR